MVRDWRKSSDKGGARGRRCKRQIPMERPAYAGVCRPTDGRALTCAKRVAPQEPRCVRVLSKENAWRERPIPISNFLYEEVAGANAKALEDPQMQKFMR